MPCDPTVVYCRKMLIELFIGGHLFDARLGGLILGRPHSGSGIYLLSQPIPLVTTCIAEIEGGEYLISAEASRKYEERLLVINSDLTSVSELTTIPITKNTRVFNAYDDTGDKYLLTDPDQFIVNKYATTRNITELELINSLHL